jgi:hypothetical protein
MSVANRSITSICIIALLTQQQYSSTHAFSISRAGTEVCGLPPSRVPPWFGIRQQRNAGVACHARQQPSSSSHGSGGILINGDTNLTTLVSESTSSSSPASGMLDPKELLPVAPALSFRKFLTMQERRVVVTIRFADNAGWKPYYLTATKIIKARHPDVLLEKKVLSPTVEGGEKFEIAVDGKVIIGNQAKTATSTRNVYCNMVELDLAIGRARRRHRPSTTYGIVSNADNSGKESDQKPTKQK